jgi:hypothetical protein
MNRIRHIRRIAGVLAGLACAMLGVAAAAPAAPAAFAAPRLIPDPGGAAGYNTPAPPLPVQVRTVVIGGMPAWQIALIATGAALLAATVAVLADRTRAAHRKTIRAAA